MQLISRENTIEDLVRFVKFYAGEGEPEYKIPWDDLPDYLPPELKIIYHEFGNYPSHQQYGTSDPTLPLNEDDTSQLFHNQDCLRYFFDLEPEGDRIAFAFENQGNWTAETEIDKSDPPVYSDWEEVETPDGMVCEKLSHFLATLCLQELVFGSKYTCRRPETQEEYRELISRSQPVWLDGPYVYPGRTYDFYLTPENRLVMDGEDRVYSFIRSNNDDDCTDE